MGGTVPQHRLVMDGFWKTDSSSLLKRAPAGIQQVQKGETMREKERVS